MQDKDALYKLLETFTESTQIPTMYFNNSLSPLLLSLNGLDFSIISEYADFDEILDFLACMFKQISDNSIDLNTFHTFYTKSFFTYNIVLSKDKKSNTALISGPMLIRYPSNSLINNFIMQKKILHHKKSKFLDMLKSLPLASKERIKHLGRLLLALNQTNKNTLYSHNHVLHEQCDQSTNLIHKNLADTIVPDRKKYEYLALYKFSVQLKDKIMSGTVNGIVTLLDEYTNLFWDLSSYDNNYRSLKNKSIILCSISSGFAIRANAPYERIITILQKFIDEVETLTSVDEIINKMVVTIETFTYLVSTFLNSNYPLHIQRMLQFLKSHFLEKITLKQLAEYLQLSPVYLSSLIKKETKLSLLDNINKIRVDESINLLIYTNKSVNEIAHDVGYNYQTHLNTVFKKFTGLTPSEFRQNNGKNNYN